MGELGGSGPILESSLAGLAIAVVAFVMLGLRRLPLPYAAASALGFGLVFALLRGVPDLPTGTAILLAAIGGSVASLAFERGERARDRQVAEILRRRSVPG